jgi:hypothetical protein
MPDTEIANWWEMAFKFGHDKMTYTYDPEIFYYERWAKETFSYKIPVKFPSNYVIITQHVEVS